MSSKLLTLTQAESIANGVINKVKNKGYALSSDIVSYTLTKQATADSGYSATYQLFAGSTAVGDKINIPKDMVVESGTVETVETADTPYEGAAVGDKYIDLVIANTSSDHIYVPVNDLVDTYTEGNGIDITNNAISIDVDSSNANGLSVGANGLALGTASSTESGALSSTDWSTFNNKQNALTAGTGIDITGNSISVDGDITAYTGSGAVSVSNHVISVDAASSSAAGTMSASDKSKLDGMEIATSTEVENMIQGLDNL